MGLLAAARDYVRLFDRTVRLLAVGQLVSSLGRGAALPFLAIYFHTVRGFPLTDVAFGFAAFSLASVLFGLLAGAVADRYGRKPVVLASLLGGGAVFLAFVLVETYAQYLAASALSGALVSLYGPAARAMVADVTPRRRRARAYGLLYMTWNLGFGVGVAAGGAVASLSYVAVFAAAALASLAFFVVVLVAVPETHRTRSRPEAPELAPRSPMPPGRPSAAVTRADLRALFDWRRPLSDAPFLVFVGVDMLFSLAWSLFNSILPVYVVTTLGLSPLHVGLVLAVNAGLVVLLQLPASALAERQPRTRMLMASAFTLGAAFLVFWSAGALAPARLVLGVMLAGMVVMTVSEMLRSPVQPAFVADVAHPEHVARYMSFLDFSLSAGSAVGPVLAALFFFDAGRPLLVWPAFAALMVPAMLGLVVLGTVMLRREVDDPRLAAAPPDAAPGP